MSECAICGYAASEPLHDPRYGTHEFESLVDSSKPVVNQITVLVCQDCIELKGEMCHVPDCVFCWRSMAEVKHFLDVMLICPMIDGERMILHGATVKEDAVNFRKTLHTALAKQRP